MGCGLHKVGKGILTTVLDGRVLGKNWIVHEQNCSRLEEAARRTLMSTAVCWEMLKSGIKELF